MSTGANRFSGAARFAEDTRQRFLTEIVARVPLDRLVEVHLFPPIRQGGVETGVAVVAAEPVVAADTDADAVAVEEAPAEDVAPVDDSAVRDDDPTEAAAEDVPGDEDAPTPVADIDELLAEPDDADAESLDDEEDAPPPRRLTIFTARYRLTVKGPDRGRWVADVVAEADAPLVTVEAVVRGVQRRAGDAAEPDRLGADAVASIVGTPPPAPPTPRAT